MQMLTMNWYLSVWKLPKFSAVINRRAAAANRPTTAGRKPWKTASTIGCFWYFRKNLLMAIIRMNDGSTTAKVAVAEPRIPQMWL